MGSGCCLMATVMAMTSMVVTEEIHAEPPQRSDPVIAAEHRPKPLIAAATSAERKELHDHREERSYTRRTVPMESIGVTGSSTPGLDDAEDEGVWNIRSRASLRPPTRQIASVFEVRQSRDHVSTMALLPAKSVPPQQRRKLLFRLRRCQR